MRKLSDLQRKALLKLSDGHPHTSYRSRISMGTMQSLYRRGLISMQAGLGAMAFPHTSISWTITPAGRAALEASNAQ